MDFFNGFFEALIDFFVFIFIPPEGYWQEHISDLYDHIKVKLPWIEVMKNMFGVGLTEYSTFSIGFIGDTVISFDWYLPYRVFVQGILSACFTLLGVFYIIKRTRVHFVSNG